MLAAGASQSGPGNGDHHWLHKLIRDIQRLTDELRDLTSRIELLAYPAERDVAIACDLVTELVSLIKEQILPRRTRFSEMAAVSGLAQNLDKELGAMYRSGQEALSAIAVYRDTLDNENQQRLSERRRSNPRYGSDQKYLQKLRYEASVKISEFLGASEGFMRFISP
jgi:hypothetical protein